MSKKISCGGFAIDNETIIQNNGVLSATATSLPDASKANDGQILIVDKKKFVIGNIPSQLPAVTVENAGQVLKVDSEGKWVVGTIE